MILTYDVQKLVPTRLDPCLSFFFLCTLPDIVREVEFTTCFERERERVLLHKPISLSTIHHEETWSVAVYFHLVDRDHSRSSALVSLAAWAAP